MSTATVTAGVKLSVGVSGSGKTYGIRRSVYNAVRAGVPVMVIDQVAEWSEVPSDIAAAGVYSVRDARASLQSGARLVIVRPPSGALGREAEAACAWAAEGGELRGIALPEAHRIAPVSSPLPPWLDTCTTRWRHHRVILWADTQRLSLLSRTITEQATELRLYAIVGDRDLSVLRATWGRELEAAVQECAARYARGEPGWHVRLGLVRAPPWSLHRD